MWNKLVQEYSERILELNNNKIIHTSIVGKEEDIETENRWIKNAEQYEYLGVKIISVGKDDEDVICRVSIVKNMIKTLHSILSNKNLTRERRKIYRIQW